MRFDPVFRKLLQMAACIAAIHTFSVMTFAQAQKARAASNSGSDVLVSIDGEKLLGKLVQSNDGSVTFHSKIAGDIKIEWDKIQELHTAEQFAVVKKDVKLRRNERGANIPQGTVSVANQQIQIRSLPTGETQNISVADAEYLIAKDTFEKTVLRGAGPLEDWRGAITGGASIVMATQKSRTYTGNISLIRSVPPEDWLDPRNRTILNFSGAYGILLQPNTPNLKTEIYHADAEHDEYFTPRVYAFGQVAFDHNVSQGLRLEQVYGGGIGWTVIKNPNEAFDLKASLSYVEQRFQTEPSQNLLGSTFAENYRLKFGHKMLFTEQISATPAWNNLNAYTIAANTALTIPVYKRLNFTVGSVDTFLNNPPPGFRKNSFQLTTGLTYALGPDNGTR
jgi:Protein of unknown function, DUF481